MATGISLSTGDRIPASEIEVEYARSSGPGGQNVNKTSTKVTLRFALVESSLPVGIKARLEVRLARRLTKAGEILVSVEAHRERPRNLEDAYERLAAILDAALVEKKKRTPTKPSRRAKARRVAGKRMTAEKKKNRSSVDD